MEPLHMIDQSPRLSIVVNNYNYASYLAEALDSAIKQMRHGDELIVVDDGSTDDSPAILIQYEKKYGITLIQQQNQGQMRAVRVGINAARKDIVVLLDSDDYFLDGYLDRLRRIYAENPDVSFVFTKAQVEGKSIAGVQKMRALLERMELPPGNVGPSMWATMLFYEFVGMVTSGISLHTSLAKKTIDLPATVDSTKVLSPVLSRLLSISKAEQRLSGYTPDGVIVRFASMLPSQKYYDDDPGFVYRIHGSNKYAGTSRMGRWYLRKVRRKAFKILFRQQFPHLLNPTAMEIQEEILGRSLGKQRLRRFVIRSRYCHAILFSQGNLKQKTGAMGVALGFRPKTSKRPD